MVFCYELCSKRTHMIFHMCEKFTYYNTLWVLKKSNLFIFNSKYFLNQKCTHERWCTLLKVYNSCKIIKPWKEMFWGHQIHNFWHFWKPEFSYFMFQTVVSSISQTIIITYLKIRLKDQALHMATVFWSQLIFFLPHGSGNLYASLPPKWEKEKKNTKISLFKTWSVLLP